MNVEEKVKAKDGHEKEQVTNEEEEEYLTDVGFMFDCHHSRDRIEIQFEKFAVSINCIDEDPGHVQSGQHLWPGATLLSNYCKCHAVCCVVLFSFLFIFDLQHI